jgi:aspartokinase/homoserine dehydrogenase 1
VLNETDMRILEFESTLLDGPRGIRDVARIVSQAAREDRLALVLPALKGVPEELLQAAGSAAGLSPAAPGGAAAEGFASAEEEPLARLHQIRDRHIRAVQELFAPRDQAQVIAPLQIALNDLQDVLHGVQLIHECTRRTQDLILSFGVLISCTVVEAYLRSTGLDTAIVDGRELIRARLHDGQVRVERSESYERIRGRLTAGPGIPLIAGGIASLPGGSTATLGWDDYTAFLIASALRADLIEIWTDTDGVMSADPAHVPEAFVVEELNYQEAMEMSYFGARILHPQAMIPAVEQGIPIRIRNGLRPDGPGTRIDGRAGRSRASIRGIASIDRVALVNIEGAGMVGIPGIAARVFGALARAAVNIMMISQASSEHSICLVFRESESERALRALEGELAAEIESGSIQRFDLLTGLVIVAVIGENMRGTPGISGRLFSALGRAEVNVLVIAQGSSERNISLVIDRKEEGAALRAIHRAFLGEPEARRLRAAPHPLRRKGGDRE